MTQPPYQEAPLTPEQIEYCLSVFKQLQDRIAAPPPISAPNPDRSTFPPSPTPAENGQ